MTSWTVLLRRRRTDVPPRTYEDAGVEGNSTTDRDSRALVQHRRMLDMVSGPQCTTCMGHRALDLLRCWRSKATARNRSRMENRVSRSRMGSLRMQCGGAPVLESEGETCWHVDVRMTFDRYARITVGVEMTCTPCWMAWQRVRKPLSRTPQQPGTVERRLRGQGLS